MKKTLLHCGALLMALSLVGCEPPSLETSEDSVNLPATLPADSNVTATAETPVVSETPAVPAVEAPAVEAPAVPAIEAPPVPAEAPAVETPATEEAAAAKPVE